MRRRIVVAAWTLAWLGLFDLGVAATLAVIDGRAPALAGLVNLFDYGRSVPGKLARWIEQPDAPGALFDVGWRSDAVARSAERFAADDPAAGPVIRGYGMSFLNQMLTAAQEIDPALRLDLHAGPSAPPNYVYALFQDDRDQRRPGDVAVLGILSSALPALAAMSNRTWLFEQPAPFTYPVYRPEGDGLRRVEPLIDGAAAERTAMADPDLGARWRAQLSQEDAFYGPAAFALPQLDASPFLRLVRRSLATASIAAREADILAPGGPFPVDETLRRLALGFAAEARAEGVIPVVALVQTRDASDRDLRALLAPLLAAEGIAYVATADVADPRTAANFVPDGHFTAAVNQRLGRAFLDAAAAARAAAHAGAAD